MTYKTDPRKILKKLEKSRSKLLDFFNSVDEQEWFKSNNSNWSVNDTLIHIVGWDELLLSEAKVWIKGNVPVENIKSEDEYNEMYLKTHKTKSKKEAIELFEKSNKSIFDFLRNLSKDEIEFAIKNESLVDLDLYQHDLEHLPNVNKIRG